MGLGGEVNGPVEKLSRDRTCFEEGKQAFQNAYRAREKKQEDVGVPEGHRGAVQPRLLKPKKNKTGNISSGSFQDPQHHLPQLWYCWEREKADKPPHGVHSWEAT